MSTAYRILKEFLIGALGGLLTLALPAVGATTYNYLTLPPCSSTSQIIFIASTITPAFGCASTYTFNSATNVMTLGSAATPGVISAPTVGSGAGVGLSITASNGVGAAANGGALTFSSGSAGTTGTGGNTTFNVASGGVLRFNGSDASGSTYNLQFTFGDLNQACTFAAPGADCLLQVTNNRTGTSDYTHSQLIAGGGAVTLEWDNLPSTATDENSGTIVCTGTGGVSVPVTCLQLPSTWIVTTADGVNKMLLGSNTFTLPSNTAGGVAFNVTLGDSSTATSVTNIKGGSVANTRANGVPIITGYTAVSASLGGGALLAGACASNTTTVTGATTTMVADASPNTYPGDSAYWRARVTAANTVTTYVCEAVAGTPTASTYNLSVH